MTKDEALKQGVEALENIDRWLPTIGQKGLRDYEADALAAMKEALAQPAQEPSKFGSPELQAAILGKLYKSHPEIFQRPQRPWVGLTSAEKHEFRYSHMTTADFIDAIEAKLKEKNIHSCSYHCQNPACIKAQRDELVAKHLEQFDLGWNAALDVAVEHIGEIKGFGQATQDSFAVFIQGLKK